MTIQHITVHSNAQVAQSVEQRTENPRVGGSIPPLGTICLRHSFQDFTTRPKTTKLETQLHPTIDYITIQWRINVDKIWTGNRACINWAVACLSRISKILKIKKY